MMRGAEIYTKCAAVAVLLMAALASAQATQPTAPTQEAADIPEKPPEVITRVYDLRDLMMNVGDYPYTGNIGMPAGREVVIGGDTGGKPTTQPSRADRIDSLIRLITETVNPDSWRDAGGTVGAIREISGLLVITQVAENHKQIETLLGQLREDHLRTVRVQADWILLTPDQARSLLPADQKGDGKVAARSVDAAALAKLPADVTKFHAELSCFSGQTISIVSGRSRSATVDQQAVVAQGTAALTPTVKQIQLGAMLQVTPTLETTLETAVVDVDSQVADWSEAGSVQVAPRQTQSQSTTGVQVGGEGPATLDRLNLLTQEFRTTARLPVGKPILIGGMTAEPSQSGPISPQLYLVLQLTAGK